MTESTAPTGPDASSLDVESFEAVVHAIRALRPVQRRALVLREIEGWSYQQIAELEGVTVESIRGSLKRARASLRRRLAEAVEEDDGFYEEDEPIEKVRAAYRRGAKGTTGRP